MRNLRRPENIICTIPTHSATWSCMGRLDELYAGAAYAYSSDLTAKMS